MYTGSGARSQKVGPYWIRRRQVEASLSFALFSALLTQICPALALAASTNVEHARKTLPLKFLVRTLPRNDNLKEEDYNQDQEGLE